MASAPTLRSIQVWLAAIVLTTVTAQAQQPLPSREEFLTARESEMSTKQAGLERRRLLKPGKAPAAQENYDVTHYQLDLRIDTTDKQISGVVTMTARSRIDNFVTVELDLDSNMILDSVGGDAFSCLHEENLLLVELLQPIADGEHFTIEVAYHGQPVSGGFGAFGFNYHDDVPIIWSLSEPYFARSWWPCKDTPSDKADSVDIIVKVPTDLIVASNGSLVSIEEHGDGTHTYHWHEGYPITTYLVSVAITNYEIFSDWFRYAPDDSMIVSLYAYPGTLETPQIQLKELLDMLCYFHEIFGPYPFLTEKYGIAQFPWGGGMEHQTITSQGTFLSSILTVHELAHQWWGDKITNANWHEIWLNEGFASYAEALYFEHTAGQDFYHTYMGWMDRDYPYPIYVDDTTSVRRIFHITVYDKAGWFLHMLRHIVGDSTFFDILLAYSGDPRFAYGNATTAGFQDVCETVSGMELDWFFEPWIYHVGRPEYLATWNATDSAGIPLLHLHIEQTQVPDRALFPMPIDITIETDRGDTVVTVFNDKPVQYYVFALAAEPTGIVLDKDGWILKKVISVSPIPTDFALRQNFPNPFNTVSHIGYGVPRESRVKLAVYDILGREVATLVNATHDTEWYTATWNGKDEKGIPVASGIYFYRIEMFAPGSGGGINFTETRKMVLLR